MKKGIFLLLLIAVNSFAQSVIYCPDYIICKNKICRGYPTVNSIFNQIVGSMNPNVIADGYYHFSYALAIKGVNLQCAYHDSEGYLRAYFTASPNLSPYVLIGSWHHEYCYLSRNKPEWADPRNCPFINPGS